VIPAVADILAARRRIRHLVDATPLHHSPWLSSAAGARVWLKLECVQLTGSFKIRGALNALMQLGPAEAGPHETLTAGPHEKLTAGPHEKLAAGFRERRVVTASAGNHGRAIALAAETLGLHATVFTPRDAPRAKLDAIRRHGADLRSDCATYDDAEVAAKEFARQNGLPFVSPYNDPDVIAGAGTIALEILEAQPRLGTIVVPIGGAGLISGVAIAAKSISPATRIIGVEVEASTAFATSVRNGRITVIDPKPTLADGLGGNMDPDTITFAIVQRCVDEIVAVSEPELAEGLRGLVREEHLVTEGAGAAAAAAVLAGKARGPGDVAVLATGSNIDLARLLGVLSA
jgi:threonine dehydratase